jgi:hypothetical protein
MSALELRALGPRGFDPIEPRPAGLLKSAFDRADPVRILRMSTGQVLERGGV